MVDSLERSFIDQTARYHASGGDLDALVDVTLDGDDGVTIEDATQRGTRLYYAAAYDWCSAINWLLKRGADVHLGRPYIGLTPLHTAALWGHSDTAVLLLDAGVRVDDRSVSGLTALHFAAEHSDPKMCKLLLSRGASLDARSDRGRDPEARARAYRSTTTADFLAAVRAAGGWLPYVNAPRKELLALRQRLPALRERGRAAPSSSVRAHERLFLDVPDDVFSQVLAFWRSARDD
jgi:ankyrin repeat protein